MPIVIIPIQIIPYDIFEYVDNKIQVVHYDADGTRTVSVDDIFINSDRNICFGRNLDGTPKVTLQAHPISGEPIFKLGTDVHIGNNLQVKVTKTETLLLVGGGSEFRAAEDGTALHITWRKQGN